MASSKSSAVRKTKTTQSRTRPRSFVPTSAQAKSVRFDHETMHVTFRDGRVLSVPLNWYPILNGATPALRERYEIAGGGSSLHWPELEENLSIAGLMAGVDTVSA